MREVGREGEREGEKERGGEREPHPHSLGVASCAGMAAPLLPPPSLATGEALLSGVCSWGACCCCCWERGVVNEPVAMATGVAMEG